jgi:flagellar hook assembly protein FlgD
MNPASFSSSSFAPVDALIVGEQEVLSRKVTIVSGAGVLVRGTVLGKITASGKYTTSLSASSDGSQTPDAILAVDVDASASDKDVPAYFAGGFNSSKLTVGTGHTVASITEGLRAKDIHLITPQTTY